LIIVVKIITNTLAVLIKISAKFSGSVDKAGSCTTHNINTGVRKREQANL
jgi:hypothetical protein